VIRFCIVQGNPADLPIKRTCELVEVPRSSFDIHDAYRGSNYKSLHCAFAAGKADMTLSFASTGNAFDNASMESVWARLEVEITWIRAPIRLPSRAGAHAYLFEFIEVFCNRQRPRRGLRCRPRSTLNHNNPCPRGRENSNSNNGLALTVPMPPDFRTGSTSLNDISRWAPVRQDPAATASHRYPEVRPAALCDRGRATTVIRLLP
jgi:hypothetical protein